MPLINELRLSQSELNEAVCDWLARKGLDLFIESVGQDAHTTHPYKVEAKMDVPVDHMNTPAANSLILDPPSAIERTIAAMAKERVT